MYIFTGPGLASCRCRPLSSNVRLHKQVMSSVIICSVNLGTPRQISLGDRVIDTGFYKTPMREPVAVSVTGLAGDHVADLSRHGGEDQAVYLFSEDDCRWWSAQLGRAIEPGYFGENLTIRSWWSQPRIGDRLHFKNLTLEVSFPRIPCATLAARVGDPRFLKAFVAASRPGLYARVLTPGSITTGEKGEVEAAATSNPTTEALFALWHRSPRDPSLLRTALAAPIAHRGRAVLEAWLSQGVRSSEA